MNRWSLIVVLLAVAIAIALRFPRLDTRPLHNDEAVNAIKVADLWQHGRYAYDPDEYHGPTLHYATLPFLWLSGARNADELNDSLLRFAPVAFGVALIFLLLLFVDGLGRAAVIWAAFFTAVSPAMVFYSRYFIHEMLLVFFAALTLGACWRYAQAQGGAALSSARRDTNSKSTPAVGEDERRAEGSIALPNRVRGDRRPVLWAALAGAGLGLMSATKETFILTLAAAALAGVIALWWTVTASERITTLSAALNRKHLAVAFAAAFLVWLVFFSSFFANFGGLLDSIRTYLPWLKRAGGHSPHIHPWSFYLGRLAWFHPVKGPAWSEGLILMLAALGAVVSFWRKRSPLLRFLALYTITLTAIYSAISYKTPWCLLNFYFGMILLAGVGASALVEFVRGRMWKTAVLVLLVVLTVQLSWQAWRASFVYASDRRNPYVYAQTVPDILNLVHRTDGLARIAPTGYDTVIKVVAPQSDYWPLPWYLRRFKHIGWYEKIPADPFAPIIIVSSKLDARLDDKSDRKWIMAGMTELRPGKFFELYVELELWKKFVETLPRERD